MIGRQSLVWPIKCDTLVLNNLYGCYHQSLRRNSYVSAWLESLNASTDWRLLNIYVVFFNFILGLNFISFVFGYGNA